MTERRMGRRPLADPGARLVHRTLRLPQTQSDDVDKRAIRMGVSSGAYIRAALAVVLSCCDTKSLDLDLRRYLEGIR